MHSLKKENQISKSFLGYRKWVLASRPKTLGAGIVPVVVGSALAFIDNSFNLITFLCCLMAALCFQLATNFINDASDFLRGADTDERIGPPRAAQLGLLSPKQLYSAAGLCLLLAFLIGLHLVSIAGLPILIVGLCSIIAAIAYTAGPYPLAYYGLGDFFVLLFFGFAAVCGTYYCHSLSLNINAWLVGLVVGLQAMALIAINNTRDIETDKKAGKNTLSVRLGSNNSKIYYNLIVITPFVLLPLLAIQLENIFVILPALTIFIALKNISALRRAATDTDFNNLLQSTGKLQVLFGLLLGATILFT